MQSYDFTAYALDGEIDLNKIAAQLQLGKKLNWEEPLVLDPLSLNPFSGHDFAEPRVYLYFFGAAVFFNCAEAVIAQFYRDITKVTVAFRNPRSAYSREKYPLRIAENERMAVTNDYAIMQKPAAVFVDIIAYALAKSVALEQIESRVEIVFDKMEEIIGRLEQGKLTIPDAELAKTAASILNFRYRSISHIMILDKPDVTWDIEEADRLYSTLANLFELQQRYSQIKHKSDTLLDITQVFTGLSHARRSARLEWIIIVLIAIEIVLFIYEMLHSA